MINILLVDDHELVRSGVSRILNEVKGFKVIHECETGEQAIAFCRQTEPSVILMDMDMPGMGGLEATKKILRFAPEAKVIILTAHTEDPFPTKVMQIGAAGYLTKGTAPHEMVNAIKAVNSGQRYLPAEIAQKMALNQFTQHFNIKQLIIFKAHQFKAFMGHTMVAVLHKQLTMLNTSF